MNAVRERAETTTPPRGGAIAAGLAGVAESGLVFLPLATALRGGSIRGTGGPLDSYPAFLVVFGLGVALATAGRRSRLFAPVVVAAAVGAGLVQALGFGTQRPASVAIAIGLALLVALRVVSLALRDWRDPIQASFGWGAGVLLIEVILAAPAGWTSLLQVVVPVFFVASLASRAASLRMGEGAEAVGRTAIPWLGVGGILAGVVVALGALAALVGGQGGLFERLGRVIPIALSGIIIALTFVVAQVMKPVGWVLHLLGFHRPDVSPLIRRLRRAARGLQQAFGSTSHVGFAQRVLGMVVLVALLLFLAWLVVRQRRRWLERQRRFPELVEPRPAPVLPARTRHKERVRRRRELPQDTVRRWYAETLLEMERKGVARPRWQTPGEYLREAEAAFPDTAASFAALTRAYEDVRYGNRVIGPERLDRMEAHHDVVLRVLREGA